MTQRSHCVLANSSLGPVRVGLFQDGGQLRGKAYKKLMFMFRIIIMLTILMSLVGTKLNHITSLPPPTQHHSFFRNFHP